MYRTSAATAATQHYADERAVRDPAKRTQAVRRARLALAAGVVPLTDIIAPETLAEHIERVVDALPPLTEAQRSRLAALLGATPALSTPTRGVVARRSRAAVSPR